MHLHSSEQPNKADQRSAFLFGGEKKMDSKAELRPSESDFRGQLAKLPRTLARSSTLYPSLDSSERVLLFLLSIAPYANVWYTFFAIFYR